MSSDVSVYELVPGYTFKVKFSYDVNTFQYNVDVDEDVEANLKFNKNSLFTFNSFEDFLGTTNIIEIMKEIRGQYYILTFKIFNIEILKGLNLDNFEQGFYCVAVENDGGKLAPSLYEKFCEEKKIPHLIAIFKGHPPTDMTTISDLANRSKVSKDSRCYGLAFIGNSDDSYVEQVLDDEFTIGSLSIHEEERLVDEFARMFASSKNVTLAVEKLHDAFPSQTKIFNMLCKMIMTDFEFDSYKTEILKTKDQAWLEKNLKTYVKNAFRPLIESMGYKKRVGDK